MHHFREIQKSTRLNFSVQIPFNYQIVLSFLSWMYTISPHMPLLAFSLVLYRHMSIHDNTLQFLSYLFLWCITHRLLIFVENDIRYFAPYPSFLPNHQPLIFLLSSIFYKHLDLKHSDRKRIV